MKLNEQEKELVGKVQIGLEKLVRDRDALLAAAKAALPYVESHNGMFTDIVSEKLRQAIKDAEGQ